MAQPNIAREPSMDEILASIRRIIESNEPVIQSNIGNMLPEQDNFSGVAANDDAEDVPLTVDGSFEETQALYEEEIATGRETVPEEPAAEIAPEPAQARSLSLADVAARVRAASERMQPPREPVARMHEDAPAAVPVADPAPRSTHHDARIEETRDETLVEAPSRHQAATEAALVSSMTGAQVARSFQDLAFAVETAQRRSFDEIASELLKPMLQEWLDDNLPTLVERLVREEIERVARGPRKA